MTLTVGTKVRMRPGGVSKVRVLNKDISRLIGEIIEIKCNNQDCRYWVWFDELPGKFAVLLEHELEVVHSVSPPLDTSRR